MHTNKYFYPRIFWELLKTDIRIYKKMVIDNALDATCWFISTIALFAYVYPALGMQQSFGAFIAISSIASCAFWDIWSTSITFVSDMQSGKVINYFLTLPLPNSLIFVKQICGYAIKAGSYSLIILPLGKLFLWNKMSFAQFSIPKFIFIYILMNVFVGAFSLFITSTVENMSQINKVGIRFLFPLWSFGGAFYSWKLVHSLSPTCAYINLLNPLLYAMEGIRSATLGSADYINFWICAAVLIGFTVMFTLLGIIRLKKRLDFV